MKTLFLSTLTSLMALGAFAPVHQALGEPGAVADAPNGIAFPADYRNWRVISVSHRTDHHSMRVILGNDTAFNAVLDGRTNPWPDGSVLGKVVWKEGPEPKWATAIAPQQFIHAEFMLKDAKAWAATGGWGYARWVGEELKPYGANSHFVQECVACHTPVKDNDWVYTIPARFPELPHVMSQARKAGQ